MVFLCYQLHLIKHTFILSAARGNVNARGLDRTMAKNIGKMRKVLFNRVKRAGKRCLRLCGNTLLCSTCAASHILFISWKIFALSSGLPLFVRNITPESICCRAAYSASFCKAYSVSAPCDFCPSGVFRYDAFQWHRWLCSSARLFLYPLRRWSA